MGVGAISGVVTSTGAPLEGVRVALSGGFAPSRPINGPVQMTDSKGRFIFTNLPPSPPATTYSLYASRPGYLRGGYRWVPDTSSPDSFRLADGEWFREAHIKLSRGVSWRSRRGVAVSRLSFPRDR